MCSLLRGRPRGGAVQRTGAEVQQARPAVPSASEGCGKRSFGQVTDRYVWEEDESMDKSGSGKRRKMEEVDGDSEGTAGSIRLDDQDLIAGHAGLCLQGQTGVGTPAFSKLPHTFPFLTASWLAVGLPPSISCHLLLKAGCTQGSKSM